MALPCLLSLTAACSALSVPADVPAMWDPSASLDPSATLPAEVAVQQVQIMASIVLALLAQPFSEYQLINLPKVVDPSLYSEKWKL